MVKQAESQFTFIARTVRQAELKQDRLQQRAARTQPSTRRQHHIELLVELRSEYLEQERLSCSWSADDERRSVTSFDSAPDAVAGVFDRATGKVARDLRIGRKHSL